ncbi:pentapeptide repeat-containing protein [Nocardiopsis sp. HNM0947]|uniref:Pentapeptide repeat-containing protein n=1 Tax=Nocardiopsis coralli TaxID=2772213 RepID=A0ABR9PDQ4_9ACTN|nr:pentapeptide repeat-containing protein [Nocardiopsis coralli]MBE3001944.1 pentapeptide repeat-containing protein [Nocardiopsis coralli]
MTLVLFALACLTAVARPLLTALVDLVPDGLPFRWAALGLATVVGLAAAAGGWFLLRRRGLPRPDLRGVPLGRMILGAWTVALASVAYMSLLIWLVFGMPAFDLPSTLSAGDLDAIGFRAFAVVAGLVGVAALVVTYRRQRTTESGEQREVSKLFTETFDSAGDKLGSEHAAVRVVGVHALARLADEASEDRDDLVQMVVNVLCNYLRMPYAPAPGPAPEYASPEERKEIREQELEFASLREVRHTIIRILGSRLRKDRRWQDRDYDFTGAVFDGGDLSGAQFYGKKVSFAQAEFADGRTDFTWARFLCDETDFTGARFTGGETVFRTAKFLSPEVKFNRARFIGGRVSFSFTTFSPGTLEHPITRGDLGPVRLAAGLMDADVVDFSGAEFRSGEVEFGRAELHRGLIYFKEVVFEGTAADFTGFQLLGGEISCGQVRSLDPPRGLLSAVYNASPDVQVDLPPGWQARMPGNER